MVYERVKYKLIDRDRGKELWLESDPMGWDDSDKTLKRSTKTYGIWTELSKNLAFVEDGADFLKTSKANRDIEADVILEEWRNYPDKDGFYLHSSGDLDFSKYSADELSVKVPFTTGGLNAIIKSQLKEKFELDRLEAINGNVIDALETETVGLEGRKIFLVTTWDTDNVNTTIGENGDQNTKVLVKDNTGDTKGNISALPLRIVGQSHIGLAENIIPTTNLVPPGDGPSPGGVDYTSSAVNMFFFNSDQDRTLSIDFTYDFDAWFQQYENVQWCRYKLSLVRFENGTNLDFKERIALIHELSSTTHASTAITGEEILPHDKDFPLGKFSHQMDGSYSTTVNLLAGESLCFELWLRSDMYPDINAGVRVYAQDVKCTLKVEEESYFDPTTSTVVLHHELGEKLLQIITGDKLKYESEFYNIDNPNEEFAYTAYAQGLQIRGFEEAKLEFSLSQLIDTSNAIHNTGYTVEKRGDTEVFVQEDMKYFFQNATTIILTEQVSNVERKTASKLYYANLKFGYDKPSGDNLYEEAMGLDEYNVQSSYTTPITRVDHKYERISKARGDSYGKEFARRKSKELFPEEDSRYDKTVFVMDLKPTLGDNLAERLWADDYEFAPTGVFSPDTASNLRLTPFRISERHQWFFGSGLRKFQQESIRHSSSVGNSNLGTEKVNEDEKFENGNVLISDLDRALFINEWITFEYEVDFYVNEQVYGTTDIDGREVPNYFGKVQFINEFGLKEYGYLFELKPNNEGKWKLLKAI